MHFFMFSLLGMHFQPCRVSMICAQRRYTWSCYNLNLLIRYVSLTDVEIEEQFHCISFDGYTQTLSLALILV